MKTTIICTTLLAGVCLNADAQVVSLNFIGSGGAAGTLAPTDMAGNPNESTFVSNWNNAAGTTGTATGLIDHLGNPTTVGVTWQAGNGTWQLPNTLGGANTAGGANPAMMKGYLDSFSDATPTTISFTGLPVGVSYDVIVYFDGDNGGNWRVGEYRLTGALTGNGTGAGEDSENINFNSGTGNNANGIFQLPVAGPNGNQVWPISPNNAEGNYIKFSGVSGSSFVLTADPGPAATTTLRAAINGVQIVGVPEPSTFALLGLAGAGFLAHYIRRRR